MWPERQYASCILRRAKKMKALNKQKKAVILAAIKAGRKRDEKAIEQIFLAVGIKVRAKIKVTRVDFDKLYALAAGVKDINDVFCVTEEENK